MGKSAMIAALVCMMLWSCSSSDTETTTDGVGRNTVGNKLVYDPSKPVNDGKPITITFWTQVDQEEIYRDLATDYSAVHPNVGIEIISASYTDHFNKLHIALQSGIGPDLFHMHNVFSEVMIPHMAAYPEAVFPRNALEEDFRQIASHIRNGEIYFIDTGLMTSSIYYNKQAWREAGLTDDDIPRTWDDLRQVARLLTRYDGAGRIVRSGFNPNGIGFSLFIAMNLQRGQRMFSANDGKRPLVDTQVSRDVLGYIHDLYTKDRVANVNFAEFHESFGRGESAMIYAWGWTNNWLRKNNPDLDFGIFPLPTWGAGLPPAYDRNNGESSMGVNAYARDDKKQVAFDIIKFFLANDKYLLRMSLEFGVAPSKRSLDGDPALASNELMPTIYKVLDRTVWPGTLPNVYEETLRTQLIDPIIIDGASIPGALAQTQERLTPVMRGNSFVSLEDQYPFDSEFTIR